MGEEVFLAVCGLMATGTRTILLSRWRVGGEIPTVLVREFAGELPRESASQAWQRAVDLARVEELDPSMEPRMKGSAKDGLVSADHPFFWSGYLLVDTGAEPRRNEAQQPLPKDQRGPPAEKAAAPPERAQPERDANVLPEPEAAAAG